MKRENKTEYMNFIGGNHKVYLYKKWFSLIEDLKKKKNLRR